MGWYGMGWDGMGWDGMGWDGMVWYGMGWDGMVWYGMVWDGMGLIFRHNYSLQEHRIHKKFVQDIERYVCTRYMKYLPKILYA
jgi:hypothetical protein